MNNQLKNQLYQWQRANANPHKDSDQSNPVVAHNPYTHSGKLHSYVAIVEFPLRRGGGWSYYKSAAAARLYESMPDHKVTWL